MFKNILVLYKKSAYKIYFVERKGSIRTAPKGVMAAQIKHFQNAHEVHYRALKIVTRALQENAVRFTALSRGQKINYGRYDLIITVGGDGTFLEAAHNSDKQVLLGVNSAPGYSTGTFCIATANNFRKVLNKILKKRYTIVPLHRLRMEFNNSSKALDALNDVLICHENPAMVSRYILKVNGHQEDQRSSGLWVSTAAGSSGAIHSAGGKILQKTKKAIQYKPRELYPRSFKKYRLNGGILSTGRSIKVISLMRKGVVYADGAHIRFPFEYGVTAHIRVSPSPVKTVRLK
ncbi:MAG TPA: NAD(+)/NADH kinase [Candidatus Omnitrophota bacterium]|nr:NAD(+)/NADH kinase [Candidatus Omnitrophota bacterium]